MERINTLVDQYDFLKNEAKIKEILDAYANNDNVIAAKQEEIAAKQKEIEEKEEEIEKKEEEIEKKKKEITNKQEEITEQKKNIDKANEELQYKDEQIKKDCEKHKQNAKNNNITGVNDFTVPCNVDNAILRDRWNRDRNGTIKKAKEIIKKNTEEIEKNTKEIETNQSELAELNKQKDELNNELTKLNNELNELQSKQVNSTEILNTYEKGIEYIKTIVDTFEIKKKSNTTLSDQLFKNFLNDAKKKTLYNLLKDKTIKHYIDKDLIVKLKLLDQHIQVSKLINMSVKNVFKKIKKERKGNEIYNFIDDNTLEVKMKHPDTFLTHEQLAKFLSDNISKFENSKTRYSRSSYANYAMYTQYTF